MGYMLNVRRALEKQLAGVTGIPSISYDNVPFTPTNGTPWVRASLKPSESRQTALGITGTRRISGVMFIDLFYPVGGGPADAEIMAETVMESFKSGATLVEASQDVHIQYSEPSPSLVLDGWYQVPLVVAWYSFF